MELKLDVSKTYAIALEGGGARGAYQVGAWRALSENGVRFNAVAGSSVGALNGAMMTMGALDFAEELWNNMTFSRVMDVDNAEMRKLLKGQLLEINFKNVSARVKRVFKDGGIDVTPLKNLIKESVDGEKIRNSAIRFFIWTHSVTERKGLELDARKLGDEELRDMLLASAYFPAFKNELLGGKRYADGGFSNVLPLSPLVSRGYKNIIAIRLYGLGVEKRVRLPKGTSVVEIAPNRDLGNMLNFDTEPCRENYRLGYYDAMRLLYGLCGEEYYIDRTLTEQDAYNILCSVITAEGEFDSLRALHEELGKFSKRSGAKGDYYDVLVSYLEKSAKALGIPSLEIYTDAELIAKIGLKRWN